MTVEIYKGFGIDYDIYGMNEYSVQFDGDDVMFDDVESARAFIDEVTGEQANTAPAASFTVESVDEFEYTGGGIWVTCGYVRDTTGRRYFFDSSIGGSWAEYVNVYKEYPYEPDDEEQYGKGCSFMPLPNYSELFLASFDPEESAGRDLWEQILSSDTVTKTYANAYINDFRSALDRADD